MRKCFKRCLGLSMLVLAGCTDIREYPKEWPAPVSPLPNSCAAICGGYVASDKDDSMELNRLAGERRYGKDEEKVEKADRIEITTPQQGALRIAAYRHDKLVAQRDVSEKDETLACGTDGVVLHQSGQFMAGEGVIGYEKVSSLTLTRDRDGDLIVRTESWGVGAYAIIPVIFLKGVGWSRFPARPTNGTAGPAAK